MGGKSKKTTIGYSYFMGLFMGLCRGPIDAIRQIRVGGKVAWTGKIESNRSVYINKPGLFGGEEQEGGIQGTLQVMLGAKDQERNPSLATMLGGLVSAFRGVTTTFFDGLVCAMSPYPKEWSYLVQKTRAGWHGGHCWYPSKAEKLMAWSGVDRATRLYIALDVSGSMEGAKLKTIKTTMKQVIEELAVSSKPVTVRMVAFSDYVSSTITRDAETGASELLAWIEGLSAAGFTSASAATSGISSFFTGSPASDANVAVLISDGAMPDAADVAAGSMKSWIDRTSVPPVDIHGIGIETEGSLAYFDNTGTSLPVISGDNVDEAVNEILEAVFGSYQLRVYGMNPAHILYRIYTDPRIGRGLNPALRLDLPSWTAAADTFYAEGMMLCLKWARTGPMADFAGEVINHAGAAVYTSRRTGKLVLQPIRGGYDVDDLPLFTPDSGLLGIDDDQSAAQTSGINEIVVNWTDVLNKTDAAVREKNLGAIMAAGGITRTEDVNYPGIPTEALARRVARRDLQAKSGFIQRFTVRLDRRAKEIMPGHVFRVSDPSRGIFNMVLRAGRVEFGTLTDGAITVTALQDVFGLPAIVYREPEDNGYVPPDSTPRAPQLQAVIEAPYRELVQSMSAADLAAMATEAGYLTAMAVRPTGMSESFQLMTRVAPADFTPAADMGAWCPGGALSGDIGPLDTTIALSGATDLASVSVGTAAMIGQEIVRVDAVDLQTSTLEVGRGCADTVPQVHAAGTAVLCYDSWGADDQTEYVAGVTVSAKLLTRTGEGTLDASLGSVLDVDFSSRAARPYPPANIRINSEQYPNEILGSEPIATTWVHRNRVTQADALVDFYAGGIAAEAGTTYTVRYYDAATNSLAHSESGIPGEAATPWVPSIAGPYRIEVFSVRDGLGSRSAFEHILDWGTPVPVVPSFLALSSTASPGVVVYNWIASGFGVRFYDPATPLTGTSRDVAFSPAGNAIALALDSAPYLSAYSWSTSGFGAKFSNAATVPAREAFGVAFNPAGTAIAVANAGSPGITAYAWSAAGMGAKFSNPETLPNGGGWGIAFSPSGDALAVGHDLSPFVTAYRWSAAGFGSKFANPATLPAGRGRGIAFNPAGDAMAVAHESSPNVAAYRWSSTGFGTKYSNPATLPAGSCTSIAFSPSGDALAMGHAVTPFVSVYPWASASGFGTKFANPAALPTGTGLGVAFSPSGDTLAVGHAVSPFITAYPWSSSGFGTKHSDPTSLPTGVAWGLDFHQTT